MILNQLAFEQFQEKDAVDPRNNQFESHSIKLFVFGGAIIEAFHVRKAIFVLQNGDHIFDQRTGFTLPFGFAPNQLFASVPGFFQTDNVQQFVVKSAVEAVAVVAERKFKQMLGREYFEIWNQLRVIVFPVVFQRFLNLAKVEIGKANFAFYFFDQWRGNFLVKEIGIGSTQPFFFEIGKLLDQRFVLGKGFFKNRSIENKPFVNICGDQLLYFQIILTDPFSEVVQNQFVKSFGIDVLFRDHLLFVRWLFGFDNHTSRTFRIFAVVNCQVFALFGIDEKPVEVIRVFQEIANQVLVKLFRLTFFNSTHQ